jgi:tRNA (guanine37-N1)-methyltransferase
MKVEIVTLFPKMLEAFFGESMMARAIADGKLELVLHDLREYCSGKHKQADDYRFGGGPGMLMRPEPFFQVMEKLTQAADRRPLVIFPTPQGKPFTQANAVELSHEPHLIFICGHYKGIDQRVVERWVDRQYSLGDYVITGGELASTVIIDAAARLLPGVLRDFDSARGDSFYDKRLDAPHYTRPEKLGALEVPGVLLDGHHKRIEAWREIQSKYLTGKIRPDLLD